MYNNHRILIDKITMSMITMVIWLLAKKIKVYCGTLYHYSDCDTDMPSMPMIFNERPYESLVDMHTMARVWID